MIINNYLNYIGSKDRYLPQLRALLERASELSGGEYLLDIFCGSAVVGINSTDLFKHIINVDKCEELIKIHQWVQNTPEQMLLPQIDACISVYKLSKENKEGFMQLREDYNSLSNIDPIRLYCLITHSFNYSLQTNKDGKYNVPFGANRSCFNSKLRKKLENFKEAIDNAGNMGFLNLDFETAVESFPIKNTVYFVDPPYSASKSKHPYRVRGVEWDSAADIRLLMLLSKINKEGGYFVFTNVLENNGEENKALKEWVQDYKVHDVNIDYSNSSYQRKNLGKTREVIITNF